MPDFRQSIEQANFKPTYEHASTTGPGPTGEQQTWNNPDEFTQSSAQELAGLLGATLTEVNYSGGPYSQNRPQYQLDFSNAKNDELDATMVYDRYQRDPGAFNQQMADELKYLRAPNHQGAVADERTWAEKGLAPIDPRVNYPMHPPGGGGTGGGGTGTGTGTDGGGGGKNNWSNDQTNELNQVNPGGVNGNVTGTTWPNTSPALNPPGPDIKIPTLPTTPVGDPARRIVDPVAGSYSTPAMPPAGMPPMTVMDPSRLVGGAPTSYTTSEPMAPLKRPGLLSSATPGGYTPPAYNKGGGLLALGMRNQDGTPFSPQQLLEFGQTGKIPLPIDKEPPRVDATANSYRGGYR